MKDRVLTKKLGGY